MKYWKQSSGLPEPEHAAPLRSWFQLLGAATLLVACEGEPGGASPAAANSGTGDASSLAPNAGAPVGVGSGEPTVNSPGTGSVATPTSLVPTAPGATVGLPGDVPMGVPAGEPAAGPGVVTPEAAEPAPPPFEPPAGMLRRLTRTQFQNALRDVFGVELDVRDLDADNWDGDFATIGASTVVTSERGVEQYHAAVESAVDVVFADPARQAAFVGCTLANDDACTRDFVETLGRRAWRRPLDASEVERLVALTTNAAAELGSEPEGFRAATVALFTSPHFLYRPELGTEAATGGLRFDPYETAARLAFLVWNSLPDDTLLDEAASGALDTPEGMRAAASRMLDSDAGRESIGSFAEQYMRLDRIATQAKDPNLFPEYGPGLQAAMVRDMRGVWESVAFDGRASALELFTTTKVIVNADLARLYGLDASNLTSTTFVEQVLPADGPRLGILAKAGFLSQFANQKEGSPTLRGKFMRQALMCTTVPDPPGDVDLVLDEPPPDMPRTKRERLELHRTNSTCASCHALMDPLGLPFETFDAIGRYRTEELGLPIDPSGEFNGEPVADSRELGATLGASEAVARCLVQKYYAYALGFEPRDVDDGVLDELSAVFQASGYQLRELVLETVTHEAFSAVAPQPDSNEVSP